ncbi:alpha/beta fold hydrolase [Rhizobium tumorigenes]|uniref:Alpha/beta hydrolase n=1 Tax=Rhizobium tumorigenes TaxID=2041385 RepID=A0AAF1KQV3_9HYPH|nr:alpha/beta hydrolase [Rhizobium tumorigenes]WFR94061.1 alpha/beta hydrolase [Rhizobium tumorigenes]
MFQEIRRHQSLTGATLAYRHQPASGTPRGILLVLHGLAEHSGRYGRFAEAMADNGYHVYAHDHRGHGRTKAPDAPLGQFARRDGVACVIADVMAMRSLASAAHPGLPVVLFGHSMGGLISLSAAIAHPADFDAVAVWNSNFHPGLAGRAGQLILGIERMLKGSDVPSALLPRLTFGAWGQSIPDHRTLFDWLSTDPAEVDAYIADPLSGFDACVSLWRDLLAMSFAAPKRRHLARLRPTLPIHLVAGAQDPATDYGEAVTWLANRLKGFGFSNITTEIYSEMRHETLHEVDANRATANFAAWCERVLPKP